MPITDEQSVQIKEQLLKQVEQLPEEQREQARSYISGMNNEQLEEFLKQQGQGQAAQQGKASPQEGGQCVFCALSEKKMDSLVVFEDKDYLAALEINPFTKGHTILIPKKHIEKAKSLRSKAFTIANRVGRHLIKKLKAESFQVNTAAEMNHAIINIIPTYKDEPLTYQRQKTKPEELKEIYSKSEK